ncbi:MAG: DeoR/GlpR family DNA-binding transcription regulator [Actinocatenispora sp.]
MIAHQRRAEIVRRLRAEGTTTVSDLADALRVSPSTIRRDLARLHGDGSLRRVHGGAHVTEDADERLPFSQVVGVHAAEKDAVAQQAARLVSDGDVLLLDVGTTTRSLAVHLRGRPVTVITSNLAVFDVLRDDPEVDLMLLGGMVRRTYHSLVGVLTQDALRQVRADRAFLGASGVHRNGYVLDSTRVEVPVKRTMISAAAQVVLLADRHKFPGSGALRVCDVSEIDVLVTNDGADRHTLTVCAEAGVEVRTA